jgi:hypothetical protein
MERLGKLIILMGLLVVAAGLIIWLAGDKFRWLGHLPGDINIERGNTRIFIPITTMILVSILLSLIMWLINKFR